MACPVAAVFLASAPAGAGADLVRNETGADAAFRQGGAVSSHRSSRRLRGKPGSSGTAFALADLAPPGWAGGLISLKLLDQSESTCGQGWHGRPTKVVPDKMRLGTPTLVTGRGVVDMEVPSGQFSLAVSLGPKIVVQHSGDICRRKGDGPTPIPVVVPLFGVTIGEIEWMGLDCPIPPGVVNVPMRIRISGGFPRSFARTNIRITVTSSTGHKIVCVHMRTSPLWARTEEDRREDEDAELQMARMPPMSCV